MTTPEGASQRAPASEERTEGRGAGRHSSSDRWAALHAAGAHPQRPLWASTSTKNPDYRDDMYVEELVAPGVVNTMPEPTIHAFADHGDVRRRALRQCRARLGQPAVGIPKRHFAGVAGQATERNAC